MSKKPKPINTEVKPKKPSTPRKSRAKPKPIKYATPGICGATRDLLLGTASGYTLSLMSTYDPTFIAQQADKLRRGYGPATMSVSFDPPPRIHVRP